MRTSRLKHIWLIIVLALLLSSVQPVSADGNINVYYAGPEGNVKTALGLAKFNLVEDPVQEDVFVTNGEMPEDATISARVQVGEAGLVLILGPDMTAAQVNSLLNIPVELTYHDNAASLSSLNIDDPCSAPLRIASLEANAHSSGKRAVGGRFYLLPQGHQADPCVRPKAEGLVGVQPGGIRIIRLGGIMVFYSPSCLSSAIERPARK